MTPATPTVLSRVTRELPENFPPRLFESISRGLADAAERLVGRSKQDRD